jgi:PhzF family phenazine biosynthesis protein
MKIPIFQVDAFTSELFKGNPAAVCPLDYWPEDGFMQNVAFENNLSETAFFVNTSDGFHIRWFTPVTEVDLCGHATLAAAAVIFEKLGYKLDRILFQSRSGMLTVSRKGEMYVLNFPTDKLNKTNTTDDLKLAMGLAPVDAYKGREDYLLVYENETQILEISPDFNSLKALTNRGVIVTAPGTDCDFVSRYFAPSAGINEDPATGSTHTSLAPYWSKKLNKSKLVARQISLRGGEMICEIKEDRVEIAGKVVFYMEGIIGGDHLKVTW